MTGAGAVEVGAADDDVGVEGSAWMVGLDGARRVGSGAGVGRADHGTDQTQADDGARGSPEDLPSPLRLRLSCLWDGLHVPHVVFSPTALPPWRLLGGVCTDTCRMESIDPDSRGEATPELPVRKLIAGVTPREQASRPSP
jgi:hypothetical protein